MHNNKALHAVVSLKSAPIWTADFSRDALRECSVLCIGGFDPSGGAGVLADVRIIEALGGHASALITLNTSQGRTTWTGASAQPLELIVEQWQSLRGSLPIHAIKIGALANTDQADWLIDLIETLQVPAVLDPVRRSSSGGVLSHDPALKRLLAHCSVVTPNREEAEALFDNGDVHTAPCPVLITGADSALRDGAPHIQHDLYTQGQHTQWHGALLPGRYRGSGCMLASALAGFLGQKQALEHAVPLALNAVEHMLRHAWHFDDGVHLPKTPA